MDKTRLAYWLATGGYFGLMVLLLAWLGWLSPPGALPISVALFLMLVPLLFPLRGILHGRPYTFAWASFLALFYLTHGIVEAYSNSDDRMLAVLEIILSIAFYSGSILYARFRAREQRQQTSE